MRIAHIIDVKDDLAGGIEQHALNLAIAQKARGDSPTVIVPAPGALTAACEEYGIPVAMPAGLVRASLLYDLSIYAEGREMTDEEKEVRDETRSAIYNLCLLFKELGVEIIHCHTVRSALKAISAGNKIGVPCIYTSHIMRGLRYDKSAGLEFATITVCRSAFERLKNQGFPEEKLYYVPNGTKEVPRVTSGSSRPSLIWVGRLEAVKGPDFAILAMADLKRRQGPDCPVLNVYGAGSLEGHLKEMVSVLCLDDEVRFHGVQVGILEHCATTDILIVSSHVEVGPLVALEAMSRGMPIVATRVGEIESMIPDQRYGYIVRERSITALADGIESMLSDVRAGRFDPDLPILRHRALFTVEKMTERVDAVYKCLITRNAPVG